MEKNHGSQGCSQASPASPGARAVRGHPPSAWARCRLWSGRGVWKNDIIQRKKHYSTCVPTCFFLLCCFKRWCGNKHLEKQHLFRETMPNMCLFFGMFNGSTDKTLTNKNIGKIQFSQNCLSSGIGHICGNWQRSQQQGTKHKHSGPKIRKKPSRPMKQSI